MNRRVFFNVSWSVSLVIRVITIIYGLRLLIFISFGIILNLFVFNKFYGGHYGYNLCIWISLRTWQNWWAYSNFSCDFTVCEKKTGCENIYFSISDTDPNLAVTFEIWSSKKDHELYLSELTESGRLSDIQFCLNGFPRFTFFDNLDDF